MKNCWQQDIHKKEYLFALGKGLLFLGGIGYLFYNSVLAIFILSPFLGYYLYYWKTECCKRKEDAFRQQFKEAMLALSSALSVGYSVENAIKEAHKELTLLYKPGTRILKEYTWMIRQLNMNVPAEQVLCGLAERTPQEDVRSFVSVFTIAKRTGGDSIAIIRNAVKIICGKIEVEREIQTVMAAKKLEFQIMCGIPFGIIFYMKLAFPDFMTALYGNFLGVGIMSICLAGYLFAYQMGKKIVEIEV